MLKGFKESAYLNTFLKLWLKTSNLNGCKRKQPYKSTYLITAFFGTLISFQHQLKCFMWTCQVLADENFKY